MTKSKLKIKPRLSAAEVAELVAEKEAELAREFIRQKHEKSLKSLVRRMEKDNIYIRKESWLDTGEECDRWSASTYRS